MELPIDIETGLEIMKQMVLSALEFYSEELEDISLLEFIKLSIPEQEDLLDSVKTLLVLTSMTDIYCKNKT